MLIELDNTWASQEDMQQGQNEPKDNMTGRFKLCLTFGRTRPGSGLPGAELRLETGGVNSEGQRLAYTVDARQI
jgi:hypothetical protein